MKLTSLLLTIVLALMMLTDHQTRMELSLSQGTALMDYHRLTYMLIHANIIHLLLNVYCLLTLVFVCRVKAKCFLIGTIIACAIPTGMLSDIPMCGMSVLNFSLTGYSIMLCRDNLTRVKCIAANIALISFTIFIPGIAAIPHAYGFILGMASAIIIKLTSSVLLRVKNLCASLHK